MKPNELMIGDLVNVTGKEGLHNNDIIALLPRIGKVVGMDEETVYVDYIDYPFFLGDIEPVHLTTDILEANGLCKGRTFVQHSLTNHTNTGKRFYPYTLLLGDGRVVITVTIDDDGKRELEIATPAAHVMVKDCQHVHQLQHALRLCGIDIDIKLKKED